MVRRVAVRKLPHAGPVLDPICHPAHERDIRPKWRSSRPLLLVCGSGNPVRYVDPLGACIIELYVVPTGQHNDGFLYHSFLALSDNSGDRAPWPAMVFRGGPGPGSTPLLEGDL